MNPTPLAGKIYEQTGMTQGHLAFYIEAKQSTLCRYEKGERSLPAMAMINMAQLHKTVTELPLLPPPRPGLEERRQLLASAAWCRMQCQPLQKQLATMQLRYRQAQCMLQVLESYAAQPSLTAKQKRWAEEQHYQAMKRLRANGCMPQLQLQRQLFMLNQEAVWYEAAAQ